MATRNAILATALTATTGVSCYAGDDSPRPTPALGTTGSSSGGGAEGESSAGDDRGGDPSGTPESTAGSSGGPAGSSEGGETSPPETTGAQPPSYEDLRNTDPLFTRHEHESQDEIDTLSFFHDDFTFEIGAVDNGPGPGGQGQFRVGCQYSHFALDDPIVHPNAPGAAHLHMFWGNTQTNAHTSFDANSTADDVDDVRQRGGGTCQGFELNRSAYWVPALLDRSDAGPHIVVPDSIILYYKSHRPQDVHPLPAGVEFLAGNVNADGVVQPNFEWSGQVHWSCGSNGFAYNQQSRIPTDCAPGDPINASIQFPQCLAVDGSDAPVLRSDNHVDHAVFVNNTELCPTSHPYRVPQITYLLYYPNGSDGAGAGVEHWKLSSDHDTPGGTLHGDWLGGWNDDAIDRWTDGCFDPNGQFAGPRNCSIGQTGQNGTGRALHRVSPLNDYTGENFLEDPHPDSSSLHD